jgi:protein-tyrosine phosphatase
VTFADSASLVDIHNHLVPGVDDGAKHLPGVLASVERMSHVGIRRIVTTPHIRGSLTQNAEGLRVRLDEVSRAWEAAAAAVKEEFPEVEYRRGHEILLDVPEPDLSDARIRMAGTSFVLVEWPRLHIPPGTPRVLRWIRDQGYRPIVAHPERYGGMLQSPDVALRWRDAGAFLQVNYGSLVGRYGKDAELVAFRLLEAGLVDYLASDFHGQSNLKIYKSEAWAVLRVRGAEEALQVLCRSNPARLLDDLEPIPATSVPPSSPKLLDRLRGIIGWRRRSMEGQTW